MPLNSEGGELRLMDCKRYLRKYCRLLKQVEDWSESNEIPRLLQDVLLAYWQKRDEDEEKKWAKKRVAVRIVLPEDHHPRIMEYFWRNFLAHANCTLFCTPNAQRTTGSQQDKKTIFLDV